jgi:hypothetical protein
MSALRRPRRGPVVACLRLGSAGPRRGVFRPGPGGSPSRRRRTRPFFFLPCLLVWWRSPGVGPGRVAARMRAFAGWRVSASLCAPVVAARSSRLRSTLLVVWSSGRAVAPARPAALRYVVRVAACLREPLRQHVPTRLFSTLCPFIESRAAVSASAYTRTTPRRPPGSCNGLAAGEAWPVPGLRPSRN